MKTISANSNGTDFIKDINDNFAECVTGGSGDGNVSINIQMQGGDLKASTGYVDGRWCTAESIQRINSNNTWKVTGSWTDDNFYKYLHSPLYLSLKGNAVKGVDTPSGSSLTIFCYDEKLTLLSENGVVNAVANIPSSAKYVKFQIYNANGFSQLMNLSVTLASEPEWIKNTGTAFVPQYFNFDCKPPKMWDDANYTTPHQLPDDATADVDNTRYHDNGCVILPPNYTPTGKPCKVVFWFNGDNSAAYIQHTPYLKADGQSSLYENNFKFLAAYGFAVVMCSGYTSMWHGEQGGEDSSLWVSRLTPAYIASATAFYDRIMANYNFEREVYLGSKSAGGYMNLWVSSVRPFPVRASAAISGGFDLFGQMRGSYIGTTKTMMKRLGCSNWNAIQSTSPKIYNGDGASATQIADANRLIANKAEINRYNPIFCNSNIDQDDWNNKNLALMSSVAGNAFVPAVQAVIDAAVKVVTTPIKFWCATKDTAVSYTIHKALAEWITRCGGMSEMRSYTGNDGDHGTFDGSAKAVSSVVTPYGGTISSVALGFIEAVEWFKRW